VVTDDNRRDGGCRREHNPPGGQGDGGWSCNAQVKIIKQKITIFMLESSALIKLLFSL